MNTKQIIGQLITLGYDKEKINETLPSIDELVKFNEYIKEVYDMDSDDDVDKMFQIYNDKEIKGYEDYIDENIDIININDSKTMTDLTIKFTINTLNSYAKLHEYPTYDAYVKATEVYMALFRETIFDAFEENL